MKNLSSLLNVILLIAVAFLYYNFYSAKKPEQSTSTVSTPMAPSSIVFVNSDSLLDKYPYFTKIKNSLQKKQDSIENILKNRGKSLENEIKDYQQKGASMTDQQRQMEEEMLGKKQQSLMQYKQEMTEELTKEEENLNDSLHANLVNALKAYNKNKNYQFILGYQKGSGILLANDSLDITKEIIEELNKEGNQK